MRGKDEFCAGCAYFSCKCSKDQSGFEIAPVWTYTKFCRTLLCGAGREGAERRPFAERKLRRALSPLGLNRDRDGVWLAHVVAVFDNDEAQEIGAGGQGIGV